MDQSLLRFYSSKGLQIGEIVEIQKNGAVASLKENGELMFIPGWKHTRKHSVTPFLLTYEGVELAFKDLIAFYIDPEERPCKGYKAVGCNVVVLEQGSKEARSGQELTSWSHLLPKRF